MWNWGRKTKYLMIGKDGDIAYFIKIDSANDDSIFSNDLGELARWKW